MDGHGRTFFLLQVFFCFFIFASTEEIKQNCSQVQCPGPLIYYHDLGCTPVYKNEGDCCAYKYNCDHLDGRSPNKCYIKHSSYEVGEVANHEDFNICNLKCTCVARDNSIGFWCFNSVDGYSPSIGANCYVKRDIQKCGPATIICPNNESEIPRCVVDGRTYRGGQLFKPKNAPGKMCSCQEGYKGDNIEPFCITQSFRCDPEFYLNKQIANKDAPVYYLDQNPATSCSRCWRRQNANDTVIPNPSGSTASEENTSGGERLTCKFGNLTMNIGDELSQGRSYSTGCVRCICEVPPTPTCKSLNHNNCVFIPDMCLKSDFGYPLL